MRLVAGIRQKSSTSVLVCFALKTEAAPLRRCVAARPEIRILLTGVGPSNAERSLRAALSGEKPAAVLTCGFAGGLDPALASGTVVFAADEEAGFSEDLRALGARPARFHCAARIAVSAAEKKALRLSTGADAVEMESEVIRRMCREQHIPSATIRVISDIAGEDLPWDFNRSMTPDGGLNYGKLVQAVLRSPGRIAGLLRLRGQCRAAARNLARVLERLLSDRR